jgi:hypothetical protein
MLRVAVKSHDDETPLSLASRLALANGFSSLHQLLSLTGVTAAKISSGSPEAMSILSDWSGVSTTDLSRFAVALGPGIGSTWMLGTAMLRTNLKTGPYARFCPHCVAHDLDNGTGRYFSRPYCRAAWAAKALQHCPTHGVEIETALWGDLKGDFARLIEREHDHIRALAETAPAKRPSIYGQYVAARHLAQAANLYLDGLEAYVAFDLCDYLGRFIEQHDLQDAELAGAVTADHGYSTASKGPDEIEKMVQLALEKARPSGREASSFFGDLLTWLRRNGEKPEFETVVDLFQTIGEQHMAIGEDQVFVTPMKRRTKISVREAAIKYGIGFDRAHALLEEAGVIERTERSLARIYCNIEQAHIVLSPAANTMTSADVADDLGCHIDRVRDFVDAGLLPAVEAGADRERSFARIARPIYEEFKDRIFSLAEEGSRSAACKSLHAATAAAICKLEDVVALALAGRLTTIAVSDFDRKLGSLLVDPAEVVTLLRPSEHDTDIMIVREAERYMKCASGTGTDLIRNGLLETVIRRNERMLRDQRYIVKASVEAFHANHISIAELGERMGVSPRKLMPRLDDEGILAIYEPTGRAARFYKRTDVQKLLPA